MRVHIGKISPALAADPKDLLQRLEKFGKIESELELGRKAAGEVFYGFIDIELDDKSFGQLRSALNGVKFKQSQLSIEKAKPKYEFKAPVEPHDPLEYLNPTQLKRLRGSKPYETDVIPGRLRVAPRDPTKPITIRITKNGRVTKLRCPRQKLWGVSSKPLESMVQFFEDGVWRDYNGKAVDYRSNSEQQRYTEILSELTEAAKKMGELENTAYLSDSDFDGFLNRYGEDEEMDHSDDYIELVSRSGELVNAKKDVPLNTTEQLRSVLSAGGDAPFTLFGDASEPVQRPVDAAAGAIVEPVVESARPAQLGLFFDHGDSAFLTAQAQFRKLNSVFESEPWSVEFYENRGEWNRELRRFAKSSAKRSKKHW